MAAGATFEAIARRGVHALERFVRRVRSFSSGPTRTLALVIAAGLFVLQCVFAVRALPDTTLSWPPFVLLVVVGTAGNLAASGLEYALVARALGQRPALASVLRISFLSSASNLLPIPGSILVRSASLRAGGAGYRQILSAMTAQGLSFLSLTGVITGSVLLLTELPLIGALILVAGIACAVGATRLMAKVCDDPIRQTVRLLLGETFVVAVTGIRIWAASLVLGQTLALGAVAALTAASVAATATGIFPGGLGIREALSGAVSPLVGLPVSFGILIGAVDRVAFLLGLGLVAAGLGLVPRGRAILRSGVAQAEFAEAEAEAGVGEVAAGVAEADALRRRRRHHRRQPVRHRSCAPDRDRRPPGTGRHFARVTGARRAQRDPLRCRRRLRRRPLERSPRRARRHPPPPRRCRRRSGPRAHPCRRRRS